MYIRKKIDNTVRILIIILMVTTVLDVLLQVISRYIFQSPFGFTDELAGFLLIWLGLIGAAFATGEKMHMAIDLISIKLNPKNRRYHEIMVNGFVIIFAFMVFIIGGIWLVYTSFRFEQVSAALQLPLGVVYLVVPLTGLLIIYYCIDNALKIYKNN